MQDFKYVKASGACSNHKSLEKLKEFKIISFVIHLNKPKVSDYWLPLQLHILEPLCSNLGPEA
jgi:hypothetical protein